MNHASFIVETDDVALLSDPWLFGLAFDNSWALLAENRFRPEDFAAITHIWISHEHPDHFSPASLRHIPEDTRANIVLLSQATRDRKVVNYCRGLGFADVRELPSSEWTALGDGFEVMCSPFRFDDSWLAVRTRDHLLLNVNDCLIYSTEDMSAILTAIGRNPDVLATQFSFASWVGNPDDTNAHEQAAGEALEKVVQQVQEFKPRFLIPSASFVWFSHEENAFMNRSMNTVGDVVNAVTDLDVVPIVLYPGNRWEVGADAPTETALEQYEADYASVPARELTRSEPVSLAELGEAAQSFRTRLLAHHGLALRALSLARRPAPTHIWITDQEQAVRLDLVRGLTSSRKGRDECDAAMSSSAFAYMLNNMWGGMTLIINGRFIKPAGGDFGRFQRYVHLADWTNHGRTIATAAIQRWRKPA